MLVTPSQAHRVAESLREKREQIEQRISTQNNMAVGAADTTKSERHRAAAAELSDPKKMASAEIARGRKPSLAFPTPKPFDPNGSAANDTLPNPFGNPLDLKSVLNEPPTVNDQLPTLPSAPGYQMGEVRV